MYSYTFHLYTVYIYVTMRGSKYRFNKTKIKLLKIFYLTTSNHV